MIGIIDLLVCPITKGRLVYDKDRQLLISQQAKLAFKIIDGVANMRVDQAIELSELEQSQPKPTLAKDD